MVGSAWTEWVRPIITVVGLAARARATSAVDEAVRAVEQPLPGAAELERERRVHDVAARQAEVEEASLRADGLGDLARRTR